MIRRPQSVSNGSVSRRSARLSQFGKRLLLLTSTLVFLVLLLEFGTRLLSDITPPLLVKDAAVGRRFRKSFAGNVYVEEAGRKIHLRFNRDGVRGPDRSLSKPDDTRRIAVIGDSFIASLAVNEEDTLVSRLQAMLNATNPQVTWEVMNFGVSGSSPGQEIALYRELVQRYEPDIVLQAFFVGNDLSDNCHGFSRQGRIYFDFDADGIYRQLPFSASRTTLSRFLNDHSRFYVWQKQATMRVRDSARESLRVIPPGAWIYCSDESDEVAYAWRLAEAAIQTMKQEVTAHGSLYGLIVLPAAEQVYQDRWESLASIDPAQQESFDWDYPNQRLAGICQKLGVPMVEMSEQFRSAAPAASSAVKEQWLFHHALGHFNEKGNQLAAQVVHRFLAGPSVELAGTEPFVNRLR